MPLDKPSYDVGYGKPPVEHRFKKGQSGNPKGRPKHAKSKSCDLPLALNPVNALLMQEFGEPMRVILEGEHVDLPSLQVVLRKLKIDAARGDYRKMKLYLDLAINTGDQEQRERQERIALVEWYKSKWGPVFDAAKERRAPEPSQLPHPDHLRVSAETLDAVLAGPQDKEGKAEWDLVKRGLRMTDDALDDARRQLRAAPRSSSRRQRVERLEKALVDIALRNVPPGWNWRECITDEDRAYYAERMKRLSREEE